ncbi:MAG: hypothetical protein CVV64_10430 [Candidatus Wallbacteria bacterium HGW-Wallbacteria-1]|jgi:SulP family sulfate permease|uniref:Cyclic nucleotide-binding domain-containing protein n=1 Tax=Candidatus Wallbacteria bacterium HGW-Wallbacteria-1 TaxID=2013854 RepID=A0A2N1PP65_9BACT|nr:MAG: hypothetical protein CVV64_10430 [Candidatus Wallbacteria bacterium HGW-Wallbacteria-1]
MANHIEFLKNVPLFETLSDMELDKIANLMKPEKFRKNAKIFSEISQSNEIYIVMSGQVDIVKEGIIGKGNQHITTLKEGHLFGEMAFVDGFTRSASAIAARDTELLVLKKEDLIKENLDSISREDLLIIHKITVRIVQTISDRLRLTNESFFYTQQSMSMNPFLK